ncbi:MAG: hypothetical protein HY071_03570 [Chloroflexi bacterium]|nr:hypothetical protein [Chloroflexota bacterium]
MARVAAIIPARGGSQRLPRKNIEPVLGAPMVSWSVAACRESAYVTDVYVSTEDAEIAAVATASGATVIERPPELAHHAVFKMDAIVHALDTLEKRGERFELVISVQANSPELRGAMLDEGIDKLRAHGLWEVFSVDARLVQNGAFRIMRAEVVRQRALSVHCGVVIADVVDVHTAADVTLVEGRLRARGART